MYCTVFSVHCTVFSVHCTLYSESALQHMTDMSKVRDSTAMKFHSTAAKLDQEAVTNLTTEVIELKNRMNKLMLKKPKLS